ncbi:uncharacterized protein LOC136066415 [Quercus suber]|uniref:uncharacterized protein LOC136066415 n=1 Tax=Quercus suber TaxID=58331 RepID=UPI0032DFAF09
MELLSYFGIAPGQLMPNSWRIVVNCMEIWLAANGDMIKVGELVHLYRLKESKEYGYYELVPWERRTRIIRGLPLPFRYWKSRFFFVSGDDFETPSNQEWGDIPRLLRRWATPTLVKRRPKLKSRYKERVEQAIEYAQTIENWDDLVDPRMLAFYNLGPDPSSFVLRNIEIEGKKKMMMKFNKDLYAKMRSKKDEPLSNLGKKTVRVTGRGTPVALAAFVHPIVSVGEMTRTASPTVSLEEIGGTPVSKRPRLSEKGKEKEKADSRPSTIWNDEKMAVDRAHEVVIAADLKALSDVPLSGVAAGHVHKIIQVLGESLHLSSKYLTQEAKVASLTSRVEALEAENSGLKKDLIKSMGTANTLREQAKKLTDDLRVERQLNIEKDEQIVAAKESIKTIAARLVAAFQTTDEYNTVLFSWYFKGFELLRRYLVKHPSGVNMEALDLEEVDQKMAADEAVQSSATETDAPDDAARTEDAPADDAAGRV